VLIALTLVSSACLRVEQAMTTPWNVAEGASAPVPLIASEQEWEPFARIGDMIINQPSARVQLIGFHQSSHDGAQQMEQMATDTRLVTLDSRGRGTGRRTAADIVVDPEVGVRAPVSGTVIRAGTYALYCRYSDDFVVIEPDAQPGWELKVLHIDGVMVEAGNRVEAGVTPIAPRATQLPFDSQVDELTALPSWPHVHIEVVDPSIPDRPGGGC